MKPSRTEEMAHEQARILAAEVVDGPLLPDEAAWLEEHLAGCAECSQVADEYQAIHMELSSLAMPEPPRDLWARTRAALDAADAAPGRTARSPRSLSSRGSLVGSTVAVAVVLVVAGASLLAQTPISRPAPSSGGLGPVANGSPTPSTPGNGSTSPLAVVNGTSYWISGENGVYQIMGGSSHCDPSDTSCTVQSAGGQTLGTIASDSTVSAAIAPNATVAAVWTSDKVAILPLNNAEPTLTLDLLTPQPTIAATATPTPRATPVPTPEPSATPRSLPSESAASASASLAVVSPLPSLVASASPVATPTPTPVPATPAPTPKPTPAAAGNGALAILSGFEIVGRDPEFSPDGHFVAFAARPSDHSAGPDIFVWQQGDRQAHAVTASHSDLFSGWFGSRILISEISSAGGASSASPSTVQALSFVFDPATGRSLRITRPMLMPVVDPTGQYVVYWSGTVEFDQSTDLWQPGGGDLYFDKWSNLQLVPSGSAVDMATPTPAEPSMPATPTPGSSESAAASPETPVPSIAPVASLLPSLISPALESPAPQPSSDASSTPAATPTPSATPVPQPVLPQALPVAQELGSVRTWQVRWDSIGRHVAVWVADKGSSRVGRLSLFAVDTDTERVDTDEPLLAAERVMSSIQFDSSHLVYTSAVDGKTYLQTVPALPPSTIATPEVPPPTESGSPAPVSTDRPGN